MKRLKKMGGLGKLATMFVGKGGLAGALGGIAPPRLASARRAGPPAAAFRGSAAQAPFNLPPGFDKFSKK